MFFAPLEILGIFRPSHNGKNVFSPPAFSSSFSCLLSWPHMEIIFCCRRKRRKKRKTFEMSFYLPCSVFFIPHDLCKGQEGMRKFRSRPNKPAASFLSLLTLRTLGIFHLFPCARNKRLDLPRKLKKKSDNILRNRQSLDIATQFPFRN